MEPKFWIRIQIQCMWIHNTGVNMKNKLIHEPRELPAKLNKLIHEPRELPAKLA